MSEKVKTAAGRMAADIKEYKWAILLFFLYYIAVKTLFHAFCPMVIITGIPCPGCGMTRAVFFMLTGQVARSLRANPMGAAWIALGFYWGYCRYIRGKKAKRLFQMILVLSAVMVVIYFYRMAVVFPDRPPMSYTRNNIFARCVPGYERIIRGWLGV